MARGDAWLEGNEEERMDRLDPAILADLKRDDLLREGHFAYRSGRHAAALPDRDRLLADPVAASRMGYRIAKRFFTAKITTIAAPSIWGAGLAQWVGYFLDPKAKVAYATPHGPDLTIAPNLSDLIRGKRVLLVDNLVISGQTINRLAAALEPLDAEVVGIGTIWNSADPVLAGHEVYGLLNTRYDAYLPDQCPLCDTGLPAVPVPY